MGAGENVSAPSGQRVAVIGSGYVGTVMAACLAFLGVRTTAVEADPRKLARLQGGRAPFWEPDLDGLVAAGLRGGHLRFTADTPEAVRASDVIFLCVGTPAAGDGRPDLTAMKDAASTVAGASDGHQVIVTKSTVPIGTAQWLSALLEDAGHLPRVVSNPEFLREGAAVADFLHPDRIVVGSDEASAVEVVARLYDPILSQSFVGGDPEACPILIRTGLQTAEAVKYAANAFLATKISFINEIANICERVGADVAQVAAAIGLDPRIGSRFLEPGIGWGGSCLGKDLSALIGTATDLGYDAPLLRATVEVNQHQRGVLIDKLQRGLHVLHGRRIALLGLAFKPGTDDVRDSPAVAVAERLLGLGALVTAYDPMVAGIPGLPGLCTVPNPFEAAERADAVVLATDWPELVTLDLGELRRRMRGNLLVDGRGIFDPVAAAAAGLVYDSFGRCGSQSRIEEMA